MYSITQLYRLLFTRLNISASSILVLFMLTVLASLLEVICLLLFPYFITSISGSYTADPLKFPTILTSYFSIFPHSINSPVTLLLVFSSFWFFLGVSKILLSIYNIRFSESIANRLGTYLYFSHLKKSYVDFLRCARSVSALLTIKVPTVSSSLKLSLDLITTFFLVFSVFAVLLYKDFVVTIGCLLTLIFSYLVFTLFLSARQRTIGSLVSDFQTKQVNFISDTVGSFRDIRLHHAIDYFTNIYSLNDISLRRLQGLSSIYSSLPRQVVETLVFILISIYWILMFFRASSGSVFISNLSIFALAFVKLLSYFQQIYSTYSAVQASSSVVNDVINVFSETPNNHPDIVTNLPQQPLVWTSLSATSLSYQHPGSSTYVFKNLSFEMSRGKCLGIIGASGSGKSTLIDIIMGFRAPSSGYLSLDNAPFLFSQSNKFLAWQSQISHVPQDPFIYSGTILNNIAFAIPDPLIDISAAQNAARDAHIHSFIESLPNGYHTSMSDGSFVFSGGQKQRLVLARALYSNPSLIILDEFTSALDPNTEAEILSTLFAKLSDTSVIIITHRTSTLCYCDHVLDLSASLKKLSS